MSKNHGGRLARLEIVWRRPCPGCAGGENRLFVSVPPEEIEAQREQADETGELLVRWCPACGRRLGELIYVGIDISKV